MPLHYCGRLVLSVGSEIRARCITVRNTQAEPRPELRSPPCPKLFTFYYAKDWILFNICNFTLKLLQYLHTIYHDPGTHASSQIFEYPLNLLSFWKKKKRSPNVFLMLDSVLFLKNIFKATCRKIEVSEAIAILQ